MPFLSSYYSIPLFYTTASLPGCTSEDVRKIWKKMQIFWNFGETHLNKALLKALSLSCIAVSPNNDFNKRLLLRTIETSPKHPLHKAALKLAEKRDAFVSHIRHFQLIGGKKNLVFLPVS